MRVARAVRAYGARMTPDTARNAQDDRDGQRVVIFDHRDAGSPCLGPHERVAACFRLAQCRGWRVEEVCGAGQDTGDLEAELERALAICEHIGARLLTYGDPRQYAVGPAGERLADIGFVTVREPAAAVS